MEKYVNEYIYGIITLDQKTYLIMFLGIFLISSIFGFVYETFFYKINNGVWTRRGSAFGPWIQIYGYGGILIFVLTFALRKNPFMVFFVSGASTGFLEYITGYVQYRFWGIRNWDYNEEKWNWGNIGGFVCFRSVAFFAGSGMILVYVVIPVLLFLKEKEGMEALNWWIIIPGCILFVDLIYNDILARIFALKDARNFYKNSGWYPELAEDKKKDR